VFQPFQRQLDQQLYCSSSQPLISSNAWSILRFEKFRRTTPFQRLLLAVLFPDARQLSVASAASPCCCRCCQARGLGTTHCGFMKIRLCENPALLVPELTVAGRLSKNVHQNARNHRLAGFFQLIDRATMPGFAEMPRWPRGFKKGLAFPCCPHSLAARQLLRRRNAPGPGVHINPATAASARPVWLRRAGARFGLATPVGAHQRITPPEAFAGRPGSGLVSARLRAIAPAPHLARWNALSAVNCITFVQIQTEKRDWRMGGRCTHALVCLSPALFIDKALENSRSVGL